MIISIDSGPIAELQAFVSLFAKSFRVCASTSVISTPDSILILLNYLKPTCLLTYSYKQGILLRLKEESIFKNRMKVIDVGETCYQEALENNCIVTVVNPLTRMKGIHGRMRVIPRCAYSQKGYVNPVTGDHARYSHLIPEEYRNKERFEHQYYSIDNYFRTTILDHVWKYDLDIINLDMGRLDYDVLVGAKRIVHRNKPMILAKENEKIKWLLNDVWKLKYEFKPIQDNKMLYSKGH